MKNIKTPLLVFGCWILLRVFLWFGVGSTYTHWLVLDFSAALLFDAALLLFLYKAKPTRATYTLKVVAAYLYAVDVLQNAGWIFEELDNYLLALGNLRSFMFYGWATVAITYVAQLLKRTIAFAATNKQKRFSGSDLNWLAIAYLLLSLLSYGYFDLHPSITGHLHGHTFWQNSGHLH